MAEVSEDTNLLRLSNIAQSVLERSESSQSCNHRECYTSENGYPLEPWDVSLSTLPTTSTKQTQRLRKSPIQNSRWFSSLDHPRLRTDFNQLIVKWWIWELLGCFGSLFSFFAIVGVLKYYDGRAQPGWPYNITINSVLSWLTTVMKAFLLFSVAACIGQANWLHFRSRPQMLTDLMVYDSASRGPLGSVLLLWSVRAEHIASLGAIITVLAIGIDPTVQQTIAILSSSRNSTTIAMLGRAQSFLQYSHGDSEPMFEMVAAIYAGIFFGSSLDSEISLTSLDVIPTCSTGNCTFPPFQSLAVCSSCENITAALNMTCHNDTALPELISNICRLSLPNGLMVNTTNGNISGAVASSGYFAPVGRSKYGNSLLNFSMIIGPSTDQSGNLFRIDSATQCFLYWCVNQYESRVENGRLHEETTGSWHSESTQFGIQDQLELVPSGLDESSSASSFIIPFMATEALSRWLKIRLSLINSYDDPSSVGNGTFDVLQDTSTRLSGSSLDMLIPFRDSDLSLVFLHLAKSMTSNVRSYNSSQQSYIDLGDGGNLTISGVGPANGTTHYNEIYVSVRWPWLAFSGALIVLTVIHLIFTMIDTARHDMGVWKLSPIALLFHGLDASEMDRLRKTSELARMEALASQIDVQLRDSGDGFKFTR